jgi:hypothetical protein
MLDINTLPDLSVDIGLGSIHSVNDGAVIHPVIAAIVVADPMVPVMVVAAVVLYASADATLS